MIRRKRNKAFLGAIVGAATSIAGSLISANQQANAQRKALIEQNRNDTLQLANNLSNAYANRDDSDFINKFNYKFGGQSRLKHAKMGCAFRRK